MPWRGSRRTTSSSATSSSCSSFLNLSVTTQNSNSDVASYNYPTLSFRLKSESCADAIYMLAGSLQYAEKICLKKCGIVVIVTFCDHFSEVFQPKLNQEYVKISIVSFWRPQLGANQLKLFHGNIGAWLWLLRFRLSSADLTSSASPKRSSKNNRPSLVSLDQSGRFPQNSNLDPLDRENEVRLFGFRRIGTVFPAAVAQNTGSSGYRFSDHKFMTMPHKMQVTNRWSLFSLSSAIMGTTDARLKWMLYPRTPQLRNGISLRI